MNIFTLITLLGAVVSTYGAIPLLLQCYDYPQLPKSVRVVSDTFGECSKEVCLLRKGDRLLISVMHVPAVSTRFLQATLTTINKDGAIEHRYDACPFTRTPGGTVGCPLLAGYEYITEAYFQPNDPSATVGSRFDIKLLHMGQGGAVSCFRFQLQYA